MNAKQQELLIKSIELWNQRAYDLENPLHTTCPLCAEFGRHGCRGCPIRDQTSQPHCYGTPMITWGSLIKGRQKPHTLAAFANCCESMIIFLCSCLPRTHPLWEDCPSY